MRKNVVVTIACACILGIISCKKETVEPPVCTNVNTSPPASDQYRIPVTVGSYWIYESISMDSTNTVTSISSIDSVFIPYDTIVNGKQYSRKMSVNMSGIPSITMNMFLGNNIYVRDSAGYIVNFYGKFIRHDDFTNILASQVLVSPPYSLISRMVHKDSLVTVPAGSFTTINYQENVTILEPSYPGNRIKYNNCIMADNIGIVYEDWCFYSSPSKIGVRLLRYHIAN